MSYNKYARKAFRVAYIQMFKYDISHDTWIQKIGIFCAISVAVERFINRIFLLLRNFERILFTHFSVLSR